MSEQFDGDYWGLSLPEDEKVREAVEVLLKRVRDYIWLRRCWEKDTLEILQNALDKIEGERRERKIN
jgi:hypothetical protein